jgi:hypothetical protein
MSVVDRIRRARRAHEVLRATPPLAANLPAKADLYREVRVVLDEVRAVADGARTRADQIRRAIDLLGVDAAFGAGRNDAEGFRDPADAFRAYDELELAFGEPPPKTR